MSFVRPEFLWFLLFLPLVWGLGLLNQRGRMTRRRWSALIVRTLLLVALIGSLAGAQLVQPVHSLTTVFLLDSSDSISPGQRSANEQFIEQALQSMQAGDKAAVVVFGENALVERVPSEIQRLGAVQSVPIAARTDIAAALQLGVALFPAETQKRLVLLSDGGENTGQALHMLNLAQQRNVPIDVVPTGAAINGPEVAVVDFQAPARARSGQEIQLVASVESNTAQTAQLRWNNDRELLAEQSVELQAGTNTFTTTVVVGDQGFHRYNVQVIPTDDTRLQNNVAGALVDINGPPKVLLVEGEPGAADQLKTALAAANVEPVVVTPSGLPTDLPGLADYETIMLVNVAARDIPNDTQALIRSFVGDLGHGLVMVGGSHSFGVGGYTGTPIEEALPVNMDVRNRQQRPDIALVFIIDKSGSMDACHCNGGAMAARQEGGVKKIDIAKEAVAEAATVLGQNDKLGVVTFDDTFHWSIDLQKVPSAADIENALAPVPPNGGTNVVSGMEAALKQLQQSDAKIKHAILLTDGWGRADVSSIAQEMRDSGITLSVVAAGNGSDEKLAEYANIGGGRYYPARTMEEVPQIFLQETIQAVGTYIVEETFTPAYAEDTPILSALQSGLPALLGYNGTDEKDTARLALVAPDGSPVLAQWQYGLGRSVAWTSDLASKWAVNWVQWEEFPRFVSQLVGWTLPRVSSDLVSGAATLVGTDVRIDLVATAEDGAAQSGLQVDARVIGPTGEPQQVTLNEVGPGQYQTLLPSPPTGTYLVQVTGTDKAGKPVFATTLGLLVPYSPEYRQGQGNPALLASLAQQSGGRTLEQPAQAFDHTLDAVRRAVPIDLLLLLLVIMVLPLDIAIRRLSLRRRDFAQLRERRAVQKRAAAAPTATVANLQGAKARARGRWSSDSTEQTPAAPPVAEPRPATSAAPSATKPLGQQSTPQPSQSAPPPPSPDEVTDPLERLRAAKNRARRH